MKNIKYIMIYLMILLLPTNIMAYSNYIIPGGQNIGIEVNSKGIMIIGFYKVENSYNDSNPALKVGDMITLVNNEKVNTIEELVSAIDNNIKNNKVILTIERNKEQIASTLSLKEVNGVYKTGLYVKDKITGIGTLTYIDPETKIFGALGHEIIEGTTKQKIEVRTGSIYKTIVTGIERSSSGVPGEKNAKFIMDNKFGIINKNTKYGIYGIYEKDIYNNNYIEVGTTNDIEIGSAEILTVLNNTTINIYEIEIKKIDKNNLIKNIYFEVKDPALLNKTGGIVQGMSGSPIIQNNKIIGAVTHVVIDKPTTGYGIFITTMLKEGEK